MTTRPRPIVPASLLLVVALGVTACQAQGGTSTAAGASPAPTGRPTRQPTALATTVTRTATATVTTTATSTASTTGIPAPMTATSTVPATATPAAGPTSLHAGMHGPAVLAVQQQLSGLGYWLGTPDGTYGDLTVQAVMALQKAEGLHRDGVLGPASSAALTRASRPRARTTSGSAIEVDKKRQIVLVVSDGAVRWVFNTSTGSGLPYTSGGHHYVATTPTGRFTIQRQIDGLRISHLGALWRPKYFVEGWALHGSPSVPAYPASHGCVRLSNPAIDLLWSSGVAPIGRTVWLY